MASAGLLGALAGLGDGMKTAGEAMWKDAIQKDRDERLAEIEQKSIDYKADKELALFKEKEKYKSENLSGKDRYTEIDPAKQLIDLKTGQVISGSGTSSLRGYKSTAALNKDSFSIAKSMVGGDKLFAGLSEDNKEAKTAKLSAVGQALYLSDPNYSSLSAAMDAAYQQVFPKTEEANSASTTPEVEPGSYDPPGLDLWGQRESADSTEIVLDLESQIMKGEIKSDNQTLSQYLNGTMNSSIAKKVLADIEARSKARDALAKGRDRNEVIERLESQGFSSYGL